MLVNGSIHNGNAPLVLTNGASITYTVILVEMIDRVGLSADIVENILGDWQ